MGGAGVIVFFTLSECRKIWEGFGRLGGIWEGIRSAAGAHKREFGAPQALQRGSLSAAGAHKREFEAPQAH